MRGEKFGACARSNALPVPAEGWRYANMCVGDEWLFAFELVSNSWTEFIKKVFTFLGMPECVCQLKYSKYDCECLSFQVLFLQRNPMAVCCYYSKQKAAK